MAPWGEMAGPVAEEAFRVPEAEPEGLFSWSELLLCLGVQARCLEGCLSKKPLMQAWVAQRHQAQVISAGPGHPVAVLTVATGECGSR